MKATIDSNLNDEEERERNRKTIRLQGFDYGTDGAYFITICSYKKDNGFSEIIGGDIHLTETGRIIDEELNRTAELRSYVTITDWVNAKSYPFYCFHS